MTDTDQEKMDEVLRRMLKTPHKPHRFGEKDESSSPPQSPKKDDDPADGQ